MSVGMLFGSKKGDAILQGNKERRHVKGVRCTTRIPVMDDPRSRRKNERGIV